MRKPRLRSLLAAAGLVLATPAGAADAITLCFEHQNVLPWRTVDGKGLNFDMLAEVARREDVVFTYRAMPWKRCLAELKSNAVDGAFGASFSRERLAVGAYPGGTEPDASKRMHVDHYVLVRKKGSPVDWDGKRLQHLGGGVVGVQLGYSVGAFLRERDVRVDEGSQQMSELAQKLRGGRVAAIALGGGDAVRLMNGPLAAELEVVPTALVEKPYFLLLSHALVKARPQLAARIWKRVEEVRNSPSYRKREENAFEEMVR